MFQVDDEDFEALTRIMEVFYEGCARGGRPFSVSDLAKRATIAQKTEMLWAYNRHPATRAQALAGGGDPGKVIAGPWKKCRDLESVS